MKEIFEKIVIDSVGKIADEVTNKITGTISENEKNSSSENNTNNKHLENSKIESEIKSEMYDEKICDSQNNQNRSAQKTNSHNIGVINAYSKNKRLNLMVIGAALGLVFCLLVLATYKGDLPGEVVGIISTIAGIFGACLKDAYSFEFGSSRGSKEKDDRISSAILERLNK